MGAAQRLMWPGLVRMIFRDPFTREIEEGRAKLVRFRRADDAVLDGRRCHSEDWIVEFVEEPGTRHERTIAWI